MSTAESTATTSEITEALRELEARLEKLRGHL